MTQGKVDVLSAAAGEHPNGHITGERLAELGEGQAFGEMALLSGEPRTATIQSAAQTNLLEIGKEDFDRLVANNRELATEVERLSHERAMRNLSSGGANPSQWAKVAASNLEHLSRSESKRILAEASQGAGLAIVLGNILDTIPGCLVIGAKFVGVETLSISSSECSWVGSPRQRRVLRRLRNLGTIQEIAKLQRERKAAGLSARTINYEIHTLRGILKHFSLWSTIADQVRPMKGERQPGRA